MISSNDFRTGMTIEIDGEVLSVVEFQHVKPGKGAAFVRTKLKNMRTGAVLERTFSAGEKLARAHLNRREVQYLYSADEQYFFMDTENYEQIVLNREQLGDALNYLIDNMAIMVLMHDNKHIGIDLPKSVELEVVQTDPGHKGDTATGGTKPAVTQTGFQVRVPLFINIGDRIRVDTRNGAYLERVN